MPKDFLKGSKDSHDVVVIGSGLAGLTAANVLARTGRSVLLLEQHYKLGGMATWFKRPGRHIFDVSLHGFPIGMIKSCRRYWNREIADSIVQLKNIRFDNPMFSLTTSFNREDFTKLLVEQFEADTAATGLDGQTGLHRVADRGREKALQVLLTLGAKIDARDAKGRTPLQLASAKAKGVKPLFQFPTLLGKFNLLFMVT